MTTAEIVGDIVQVVLTDAKALESIGVTTGMPYLKVIGIDDLGLWVEHPQYVIVKSVDANGKPLPEDQRVETRLEANFLLRWDRIATLVHFPNREGFDFPNPMDDRPIGFVQPEEDS